MRLLYCSARPPLPFGFFYGSTRTAATILQELANGGVACDAVGLLPWRAWKDARGFRDHAFPALKGIGPVFHYRLGRVDAAVARDRDAYLRYVQALLDDPASRPDALWTELELSDEVVRLARKAGVRTLVWLKDLDYSLRHAGQAARRADVVVCSSAYMRKRVKTLLGREALIVPEAVCAAECVARRRRPSRLTMINPVRRKGGDIFLKLAALMPERRFLAVSGWTSRAFPGRVPSNVEVLPAQRDMRPVFARTDLVLMASRWEEAFGRVAAEAMLNGIPVIAARSGGLPQTLGRCGLLIDDLENVNAWTSAIERLSRDQELRRRMTREGPRRARAFGPRPAARRLLAALS